MARKFWTLAPNLYFTQKQLPKGGRNEIWFTAVGIFMGYVGCIAYYFLYTNFHSKARPSSERALMVNGKEWF